jgi:hypothetical protein
MPYDTLGTRHPNDALTEALSLLRVLELALPAACEDPAEAEALLVLVHRAGELMEAARPAVD